jgi:hypothetical protein
MIQGRPLDEWLKRLDDLDPETRLSVVTAFSAAGAGLRGTSAVPALAGLLSDATLAIPAMKALARIGDPASTETIIARMANSPEVHAYPHTYQGGLDDFIETLRSENAKDREHGILLCGLRALLNNRDERAIAYVRTIAANVGPMHLVANRALQEAGYGEVQFQGNYGKLRRDAAGSGCLFPVISTLAALVLLFS